MQTLPNSSQSVKSPLKSLTASWVDVMRRTSTNLGLTRCDASGQQDLFAPRLCNTGAQISQDKITSKVDWLEFTVKSVDPSYSVLEYLALSPSDFTLADYGMQGYTDCQVYGFVKVLNSPEKPERGTKIILSGQALDEVGKDALEIIKLVLRDGGTFARIDLAMDDRMGLLSIDGMWQAEIDSQSVSHFKDVSPIKKYNRHTKELSANGVNWGSRTSGRFVRAYDKEMERRAKVEEETGHWIRVEMQANKRSALVVAATLAQQGYMAIPGIMVGCLDFRHREDEDNSTRAVRLSWWDSFIGQCKPLKTGAKKAIKTVEDKLEWLSKQCRKTMAQVAVGFSSETILRLIESGLEATTKREWEQLFPDRNIDYFMSDIKAGLKPCPF